MTHEIFEADWDSATRADLLAGGLTRRQLERAVRDGTLIRAKRDRYVSAAAPHDLVQAVRVGGRLTCLSLLRLLGVFVFACDTVHVHISRGASRLRSPHSAAQPLPGGGGRGARLHWHPLVRDAEGTAACVGIVDALIHAVRCQQARYAIATLDSALNKGLITALDLADVFAALPKKFAGLQGLVDARAQSGPETLVRLMLRGLGCDVDLQVAFERVGFVDMVVDGWLVVECDSQAFHSTWKAQLADRRRDAILASYGYCVFRVTAEDILSHPERVMASLRGLVATRWTTR